jgi:anti-sigma factor RsiW
MNSWIRRLFIWPHPRGARLIAFNDGELEAPKAETVSEHLQHCQNCRHFVAEQGRLDGIVACTAPSVSDCEVAQMLTEGRRALEQLAVQQDSSRLANPSPVLSAARMRSEAQDLFGARVALRLHPTVNEVCPEDAVALDQLYAAFLGKKERNATHAR